MNISPDTAAAIVMRFTKNTTAFYHYCHIAACWNTYDKDPDSDVHFTFLGEIAPELELGHHVEGHRIHGIKPDLNRMAAYAASLARCQSKRGITVLGIIRAIIIAHHAKDEKIWRQRMRFRFSAIIPAWLREADDNDFD